MQRPTPDPEPQRSVTMARLLTAFTFASDLAFALEFEDGIRSCYLAARIAEQMGLSEDDRVATYYTAPLKDAGCTCFTSQLAEFLQTANELTARRDAVIFGGAQPANAQAWLDRYVGSDLPPLGRASHLAYVTTNVGEIMRDAWTSSAEVCSRISARFGMPAKVLEATRAFGEQWDGLGVPNGLKGDEVPLITQIVMPTLIWPAVHRTAGREAAKELTQEQRGHAFSPAVCDAFLSLAEDKAFWQEFESPAIVEIVVAMEPAGPLARVDERRFDDLAEAFADFVDLKSPFFAAHSRRVAKVAEQIAHLLHCREEETRQVRRAALMHDLGIVGVPSRILDKPATTLTATEHETLRLHPYIGERIVGRVPAFDDLRLLLGSHHEHMDGSGYFRGSKARDLPQGARIIAVANRLNELTHDAPGASALPLSDALQVLRREAGSVLDPDIVDVLCGSLGARPPSPPPEPHAWPAGLTDREVEVLRLAARGLTRREVGEALGISENTVRHHLEHIYGKTGTTTRVGATLFAMEHDLLA